MKKLLRRSRWAAALLLPLVALGADVALAQKLTPMYELTQAVGERALPYSEFEGIQPLADCSGIAPQKLQQKAQEAGGFEFQWINGRGYFWYSLAVSAGRCIYLAEPEGRGLNRSEARVLLSASELEFPLGDPDEHVMACGKELPRASFIKPIPYFDQTGEEQVLTDIPYDTGSAAPALTCAEQAAPGGETELAAADAGGGKSGVQPGVLELRRRLTRNSYPFNAIAMTDFSGRTVASAVQITPYVYATAAHVVLDPVTRLVLPRGGVRPNHNNPSAANKIPAAAISWHSLFTYSRRDLDLTYDLAFIMVSQPRQLSRFPRFHVIDTQLHVYRPIYDYIGNPAYDLFYAGEYGSVGISWYDPRWNPVKYAETIVVGYPNFVGNQPNLNNHPYFDTGNLYSDFGYQVSSRSNGYRHFLQTTNQVSPGNSGGPIFGHHLVKPDHYALLGIVSSRASESNPDTLGSGRFDYLDGFFANNLAWTPGIGVRIHVPENAATYRSNEIPDFTADAGADTAQLQWYSDIDGHIGSGGHVVVNNRLSLGTHEIRVMTGPAQQWQSGPAELVAEGFGKAPQGAIRVLEIEVIPGTPQFSATPNPALVPLGDVSALTTLSWLSPTFANVDIYRQVDGSKVKLLDNGPASGTLPADVFLRKENVFQLYAHGDTTRLLKSVSVYGKPEPWLKADPATVLVPADAQQATSTISWGDFDGAVRLFVSANGASATEVSYAPNTYSVQIPWIKAGQNYDFRLHRAEDINGEPLRTVRVRGVAGSITATPNPVLIPAGQTSRSFDLAWDVPVVAKIDIWASRNGAAPVQLAAAIPAQGSSLGNNSVAANDTITYRVYESGRTSPTLATTVVRGQSAGSASLSASPNPVMIAPGQTTRSYDLSWNAPGHDRVDIYGERNGQGRIKLGDALAGSGSSVGNNVVAAGERVDYWLYPAGNTSTVLATLRVQGQAAPAATFRASPNPVIVPYGQAKGYFDLHWDIYGYAGVDIYAERNGPPRVKLASNTTAQGSSLGNNWVAPTDQLTYWIYPAGATSPLLATLQVNGRAGATPSLRATPNPVVIPAGQNTATYDLYWNVPGYSRVDIYAERNGPPRVKLASGADNNGSSLGNNFVAVGDRVTYWIYPEGTTSPLLATLQVTGQR